MKHVQWANDSTVLFSSSYDNTVKVWTRDLDEDDWVLVTTIPAHSDTVWNLAIHAEKYLLVTVSQSAEVALWDLHPLAHLLQGHSYDLQSTVDIPRLDLNVDSHTRPIYSCEFSQDGDVLVTAGGDNRVCVFRVQQVEGRPALRRVALMKEAHQQDINCVSFDSSAERLFTAGDDCLIKEWQVLYEEMQ